MTAFIERLRTGLAGRYAIERELGRGGMATVYLGRDLKHQRAVAIKTLHPALAASLGSDRFMREIEIAAGLSHPHILPLHDSGSVADTLYYTMPYVEGESLRARMSHAPPLTLDESIRIAREIADALTYAHDRGIVHRDIKPENVLLSAGHAVVADFGIARAIKVAGDTRLTSAGMAVGTAAYMSPEQAQDSADIDGRSDVYSLGCVLYEMLAGRPPFEAKTPLELLARHSVDVVPPLRSLHGDVPPTLDALLAAALAKIPANRPSAADFARALTTPEAITAQVRAVRRRRIPLLIAGGALAGAAVIAWRLGLDPAPALDAQRVVVFPVSVGSGVASRFDGEDIATAIVAAFNSTGAIKGVDGWRLLRNAAPDSEPTERSAARVAKAQRAGFFLDAHLLSGDSLRLVLDLHDVGADSTIHHTVSLAPRSDAWTVGMHAVRALLPALITPNELARLPAPTSPSPAAATAYLLGQRQYRRARFDEALRHFRAAVAADSTFALAALGGAQAASWERRDEDARALAGVALRAGDALPVRYRSFASGLASLSKNDADSAIHSVRRALAVDSEWAEGWMALGEAYEHLLPREGAADSIAQAAYERVHRLDPGFVPVLYHLLEGAARRGDAARATRLMESLRKAGIDSAGLMPAILMLRCVVAGPHATEWSDALRRDPAWVRDAAFFLSAAGLRQPRCAEAAWSALWRKTLSDRDPDIDYRVQQLFMLQSVLLAQGRYADVRRLLSEKHGVPSDAVSRIRIVNALAGAPFANDAAAAAESLSTLRPARRESLWLLGIWRAGLSRPASVRALADSLRARERSGGDWRDGHLARALDAWTYLAQGDSARALASFAALRPRGPLSYQAWQVHGALGPERAQLARLLLARGRPADAIEIAATFDSPATLAYLPFLPASLELRARASSQLGDTYAVDRFRARLAALGRSAPTVAVRR